MLCTNMPPEPQARVINFPLIRLNHLCNQVYDALGGIKFSFSFAFGQCKLAQEIFVNPPNDILLFVFQWY